MKNFFDIIKIEEEEGKTLLRAALAYRIVKTTV